jgi:hypothetical protein
VPGIRRDPGAVWDLGRYFDQALKLAKDAGYTHCLRMRGRKQQLVPLPGG